MEKGSSDGLVLAEMGVFNRFGMDSFLGNLILQILETMIQIKSHFLADKLEKWLFIIGPFIEWPGDRRAKNCSSLIIQSSSGCSAVQSWTEPTWTEMPAEECCSS